MKNLLIIPLLLFISIPSKSQFILTPEGLRNKTDLSLNYIVKEIPGKSKEDLYNSALIFFNTAYFSPKEVISGVDNEVITISGFENNQIGHGGKILGKYLYLFDLSYSFTIRFKDNKIRMDEPNVIMKGYSDGKPQLLTYSKSNKGFGSTTIMAIFKKEGSTFPGNAKDQLEEFFNNIFNTLISDIESSNQKEDW